MCVIAGTIWADESTGRTRVELTPAQRATLEEQVIAAYWMDRPADLITVLSPLVARLDDDRLEAADRYLTDRAVPSIAELLSRSRLRLVIQNDDARLPPPKREELYLTLRGLKSDIDDLLGQRSRHAMFNENAPQPTDFADFDHRFWDAHVLENQLAAGALMARYGVSLHGVSRSLSRKAPPEQRTLLETDFSGLLTQLTDMNQELAERTMELRISRLRFARDQLVASNRVKERFQAAFVVDLDGELLAEFARRLQPDSKTNEPSGEHRRKTKTTKGSKTEGSKTEGSKTGDDQAVAAAVRFRTALADPELPAKIAAYRDTSRAAAGNDFIEKSRLLFTGLHWWTRGRYGLGTEAGGLLKNKLALTSPQAQFGLYMPVDPRPTAPSSDANQMPQYPRRHFYLWQFETRDVAYTSGERRRTLTQRIDQVISITHLQHFY